MAELFSSDLDTERLIMGLELYVGHKIDPGNSLLIFDEVQEVPRAFKLFMVDVGLLGCMAGLRQRTLLDDNDLLVVLIQAS